MNIPRPEHPNPQWERKNWRNLNGEWEFEFDFGRSAKEKELYKQGALSKKNTVPFCPESTLSGIEYTDFIPSVCYRKVITISEEELSGNVFICFGAVDFHSYVYINGQLAGEHIGGYASFKVDITPYVTLGENTIFVIAEDDVRSRHQPAGKQSAKYHSYECFYTRTTGIWQTVWLEFTPEAYIKSCKYYPDITNGILTVTGEVSGCDELEISSFYEGKSTGSTKLCDKTRPCIDVSGNYHIDKKEIHDVHDYEQNPEKFSEYYAHIDEGIINDQIRRAEQDVQPYFGEPVFVSEYGGIKWAPAEETGWGYGDAPKTEKEFTDRYCRLTDSLISNPYIMGLCYTQLYDVEQEQNGLYYYDRTAKFNAETIEKLCSAMIKKAEIEK